MKDKFMRLNMSKILKIYDERELEVMDDDYYLYENKLYFFIWEDDTKIDYNFVTFIGYNYTKFNKINLNISVSPTTLR